MKKESGRGYKKWWELKNGGGVKVVGRRRRHVFKSQLYICCIRRFIEIISLWSYLEKVYMLTNHIRFDS